MGKILRIGTVLCLAGCLLLPARAQTRAQRVGVLQGIYNEKMVVSLVPIPLAFSGFRIDFDCRLKDRLWLQVAPQYNCKRRDGNIKTDGFCLEANLRYFLKNASPRGFYIASGLGLDYNQIQDLYRSVPYHVNATRVGGQLQIGFQFGLWPRAVMDVYLGAAFRHAFNRYPDNGFSSLTVERMTIKPWQYHYSGLYMIAGIRIGLLL
ncbi:MAG: DUF3575 domain-containing protein [Bacteroidales bacterium]|nr:DUF3575 domain-containing protein [Bacteroidales bacterium]MDE7072288.1 DUF3575 domain-containing protein [Bacteroidales bacterium]